MSTHDFVAAPLRGVPRIIEKTVEMARITLVRPRELKREFPGIVRGLRVLWKPFHREMRTIFVMNSVIAVWESMLLVAAAMYMNALAKPEGWTFIGIAFLITVAVFGFNLLHEIVFPLIRELYIYRHFRVDFPWHVTKLCIHGLREGGFDKAPKNRQQAIRDGCEATYKLTEMILRDPAFAIRGFFFMVFFCFQHPLVMLVGITGMVIDIMVILYMDAQVYLLSERKINADQATWGSVSHVVDDDEASRRSPEHVDALIAGVDDRYMELKDSTTNYGITQLKYQELVRNPIALTIQWGTMLILARWVYTGYIQVGDFAMYIGFLGRATGPFQIFYAFQQQIMNTRQALRRTGEFANIDFGLIKPEHVAGS